MSKSNSTNQNVCSDAGTHPGVFSDRELFSKTYLRKTLTIWERFCTYKSWFQYFGDCWKRRIESTFWRRIALHLRGFTKQWLYLSIFKVVILVKANVLFSFTYCVDWSTSQKCFGEKQTSQCITAGSCSWDIFIPHRLYTSSIFFVTPCVCFPATDATLYFRPPDPANTLFFAHHRDTALFIPSFICVSKGWYNERRSSPSTFVATFFINRSCNFVSFSFLSWYFPLLTLFPDFTGHHDSDL